MKLPELIAHLMQELDWFGMNCAGLKPNSTAAREDWYVAQHKAVIAVAAENEGMAAEPFIGYAHVEDSEGAKLTFLFRRGYLPLWEPAKSESTSYANYLSNVGVLVELDPGETKQIETVRLERLVRSFKVLATNKFSIARIAATKYDAVKNRILILGQAPASIQSLSDYLSALGSGSAASSLVSEKRSRSIIETFALRDQPILDAVQGEIFRQPFSSQIILSGAAGTGKTTTLIKRIARNQKRELLSSEEQGKFEGREFLFGQNNWALFLPSDLLKGYVQEAFAKQGIAASSQRVRVWSTERLKIAREILAFARIGNSGTFTISQKDLPVSNGDCVKLYSDFESFWPTHLAGVINSRIKEAPVDLGTRFGPRFAQILSLLTTNAPLDAISEIRRLRNELSDGRQQANEDRERGRRPLPPKQSPPRVDEYFLSDNVKKAIDRLEASSRNLVAELPSAFRGFIATLRQDNQTTLAPHESDVLIRSMLTLTRTLTRIDATIDDSLKERVRGAYIPQVLIDEVADFSSNQIAILASLADPQSDSVTLCGDVMQRVTHHGITSWDDCKDVLPKLKMFHIDTAYRQSPQLLAIAVEILKFLDPNAPSIKSAYAGGDFPPALMKVEANDDATIDWISNRIINIYEAHGGKLPAIAVLVSSEEEVEPTAKALRERLELHSLEVQACRNGEVLGNDSRVRVFNVQFIKGLEFEAVFFLRFDAIQAQHGNLALNYLYVGLTRAATFLGVTSRAEPKLIHSVLSKFSRDDSQW